MSFCENWSHAFTNTVFLAWFRVYGSEVKNAARSLG